MRFDKCIDHCLADLVIVVGVVLQSGDVAQLILGWTVKVTDLTAPMIPILVLQFGGNRAIRSPELIQSELLAVRVGFRSTHIFPVVSRVIDNHIENDPHRERLAGLF
jgi:hypothetical protein